MSFDMRCARGVALVFAFMGVWGLAPAVQAQLDLNQFRPSEVATDGFAVSTADDLGDMRFGAQIYLDYADDALIFTDPGGTGARVVDQQMTGHLQLSFGLIDRLVVYAGLPYHFIVDESSGDDFSGTMAAGIPLPTGSGLGDLWVGARGRIWGTQEDIVQLAVQAAMNFHTAQAADGNQAYKGGGDSPIISGHPELLATFNVLDARLRFSANLGFWIREDQQLGPNTSVGDELTYGIGGIFKALEGDHRLDAILEWFGRTGLKEFGGGSESPMELLGGLKYHHHKGFTAGAGAGLGLTSGYGAPEWRVLGMVAYTMPEKSDEPAPPPPPAEPPPPSDKDGDGITDDVDQCKRKAEDMDGFEDEDGCPEDDNDDDGLLDGEDKCPNEAGPVENMGCPDTDKDGDGVVDRLDNCPDVAGTVENRGCEEKQLVEISSDSLEVLEKVYFRTASSKILMRSYKLLDNVAAVINAHPEIAKIRVEGHTDSVGNDAQNMELSQARAESVVKYLVGKGVDAGRLEAKGFGETNPVVKRAKTDEEHAQNRRVEFNMSPN